MNFLKGVYWFDDLIHHFEWTHILLCFFRFYNLLIDKVISLIFPQRRCVFKVVGEEMSSQEINFHIPQSFLYLADIEIKFIQKMIENVTVRNTCHLHP